jgi:hypothetical protein
MLAWGFWGKGVTSLNIRWEKSASALHMILIVASVLRVSMQNKSGCNIAAGTLCAPSSLI